MKLFKSITAAVITITAITLGLSAHAGAESSARCLFQYNQAGFNTSTTPVFNSICGKVPEGINNEPDFVRIRQNVNGDDENNLRNPAYRVGTLDSACKTGDKYDIWSYVDNNASELYNPGKGSGSAVAKDTSISPSFQSMSPTMFNFMTTISASNADPVTDNTNLNCSDGPVKLDLVPGSVHVYSTPYGNWENMPNSAINARTLIGSTIAGLASKGSGQIWGGWTYRLVIVYQVEATSTKPKIVMPVCKSINLTNNKGTAVIAVDYSSGSSVVAGINLITTTDSSVTNKNLKLNQFPYSFRMSPNTLYNFKATISTSLGNVTSKACNGTLSFASQPNSGSNTTTTTTTTNSSNNTTNPTLQSQNTASNTNTQLVNTGPGSYLLIFLGAGILSSIVYLLFTRRNLKRA